MPPASSSSSWLPKCGRRVLAVLDLRDALADQLQRLIDRPTHAQRQHAAGQQAGEGQQQAGQQAAVALQQGALVRQLQLDPAEQALVLGDRRMAAELAVMAVDRQQEAGGVDAAHQRQALGRARRRLGAHARAGVGQAFALRGEQADGAHVGLLEGQGRQALEQRHVAGRQQARAQWREVLDQQLAALGQLPVHLLQLDVGEIAAQDQRQQAGGQQGQQQDAPLDAEFVEHADSPPRHRRPQCSVLPGADKAAGGGNPVAAHITKSNKLKPRRVIERKRLPLS